MARLEKLKQDDADMDGRYRNCGQLFCLPNCTEVTHEVILKVVRQMNPEQRREFTRLLFA